MTGKFTGDSCRTFSRREVVYGADVVEATTSDVVARGRVGASHDPRAPQRDRMDFIRGVGVPDDQLAVLRRRHEMSSVGGPMHGVDFRKVTFECSLGPKVETRQWFCTLSGDFAHYEANQ